MYNTALMPHSFNVRRILNILMSASRKSSYDSLGERECHENHKIHNHKHSNKHKEVPVLDAL